MILDHIMRAVNAMRPEDGQLEPHQLFDMIGGTSTGGYVDPYVSVVAAKAKICPEL